jgi:glycerol-1-phosphate dehydrogenase [NAD(P)+]
MKIKEALKKIGAPTTAKDLGVTDEQIVRALMMAHDVRKDRYTILGESGLTKEAAEKLAHITGVIS